jgi:hypothetical protein
VKHQDRGKSVTFLPLATVGVVVELSWLLTLLLSELLSSSGSLLPDLTPRTSGRPELCRILLKFVVGFTSEKIYLQYIHTTQGSTIRALGAGGGRLNRDSGHKDCTLERGKTVIQRGGDTLVLYSGLKKQNPRKRYL